MFSQLNASPSFKASLIGHKLALAAVMGSVLLAAPLSVAYADPTPMKASASSVDKGENIEQRIATLHSQLKITPAEESVWAPVAQAMRDNAASMEKLVMEKRQQPTQSLTALDDLKTYQMFAQAHVDGLKNLTSAFESLYTSMPDDQKRTADHVFMSFGQGGKGHARS